MLSTWAGEAKIPDPIWDVTSTAKAWRVVSTLGGDGVAGGCEVVPKSGCVSRATFALGTSCSSLVSMFSVIKSYGILDNFAKIPCVRVC